MGYGPVTPGGKHAPITPWKGSWAEQVNRPIPEHIKRHHTDQHAATHSQRLVIRKDIRHTSNSQR